jgi:hypothetical protein
MASETLISPGVFLRENDLSQITQGPIAAGAALIGPTVTGLVNVPTLVTSYSEYKSKFGSTFISGGTTLEYLTSIAALNYFEQGGSSLLVTRVASGSYTTATASVYAQDGTTEVFQLTTLTPGTVMNNAAPGANVISGSLPSGSTANVRYEVVASNSGSGLFSLVIRRGDDTDSSKAVLETWTNLSLDPNEPNYVAFVLGDTATNAQFDENGNYYAQTTGSYANKSNYVRVKSVNVTTPNYFDNRGVAKNQYTASLPKVGSGSAHGAFGGAEGALYGGQLTNGTTTAPLNMYEAIPNSTSDTIAENIQGIVAINTSGTSNYDIAINMMKNKDAYRYNVLYAPGLTSQNAPSQVASILQLVSDRGDAIAVVDMVGYAQSKTQAIAQAANYDNSYGATYWPWVQIRSRETGKINHVPASTLIPSVYEYNDKVSAEWFAPAGLNRGGLASVLQPERRVSVEDRNFLYQGKVNPIAVFPGVGTVVYGQKTLQSKASALDRVNVRRLLIALKSYIGQVGETLVFEPNTQVTRNRFLNQVNPYLEYVQQRQGLYAFQVTMDESNNTPDVIDRNQLVGTIYLQPTRAAEYIYLNFNVLPTGTSFS